MAKSSALPWQQHPQPKPVGYEDRPGRGAYRGQSFRLVLEPIDGPQYSALAVVAFLLALGALVAAVAIEVSTLLLAFAGSTARNPYDSPLSTLILGMCGLAAVVLGHLGLHRIHTGVRRGLVMAGFTLGASYALLCFEALAFAATR